ncbi:MAG: hypothetical protein AAFQ35_12235, partial [Pseudomonadota bacterium]
MVLQLDGPPRRLGSFARGDVTGVGDIFDRSVEQFRLVENMNGRIVSHGRAYDAAIAEVQSLTGVALENPIDEPAAYRRDLDEALIAAYDGRPNGPVDYARERFSVRLSELARDHPDHAKALAGIADVTENARRLARESEHALGDALSRYQGPWGGAFAAQLAGGFRAMIEDPGNVAAMMIGGPQNSARSIAWNAMVAGATNAAVEGAMQPWVQAWRAEAGLEAGLGLAVENTAYAFLFGAGFDAAGRGAVRGTKHLLAKRKENAEASTSPDAPPDPAAALTEAASRLPRDNPARAAVEGDPAALAEAARVLTDPDDAAARGALAELEKAETGPQRPEGLDEADHLNAAASAVRAAIEPERQAPPRPLPPRRAATDPYLGDDRPAPTGRQIEVAGKPATRGSFDPTTIGTDADAFQFKGGGDSAGVTERLQGVTRWDPMASGNVVLFERADGTRVIADGHQRLGLARRIARDDPDQSVRLDGYLFREVDGWTPSDVRVVAAKKNLQEGSGDAIDAARVIREAPDVLDASVPVSSEQMRQARQLARLSDEAFGMVVGGVVPANHAAALGEAQVAPHRHVGILSELAQVGPSNVREARLLVAELAQMPANAETQMTLLGAETTVRPLLRERVKVLDAAMQRLRADTR